MLSRHQDRNHHVRDIRVGQLHASLVLAPRKSRNHIMFVLPISPFLLFCPPLPGHTHRDNLPRPPLLDDIPIKLADLLVRLISPHINRQGQVRKHKVDRNESRIEVPEELGEFRVEGVPDFLALQRARGGEDDELRHGVEDLDGLGRGGGSGREVELVCEEMLRFGRHERGVGLEGFGSEAVLDLGVSWSSEKEVDETLTTDEFLLLHEHLVGAIKDDTLAKHRRGQVLPYQLRSPKSMRGR